MRLYADRRSSLVRLLVLGHIENIQFNVAEIGANDLILGLPWLSRVKEGGNPSSFYRHRPKEL